MSLISGFETRYADISRPTYADNKYGAKTASYSTVSSAVKCKIDSISGHTARLLGGKQAKSTNLLFCDAAVDIRVGDRLINIRDIKTGIVDKVALNGTLVPAQYIVEWTPNPGTEDDHLEVLIYKLDGQDLN
jgi:hypothetical protein